MRRVVDGGAHWQDADLSVSGRAAMARVAGTDRRS